MNNLLNQLIYEPWPWYIGGPLIGLFVISLLLIEKKSLGVSSSFDEICQIGSKTKTSTSAWQITFVIGLILGGSIIYLVNDTSYTITISEGAKTKLSTYGVSNFEGYVPSQLFNFESVNIFILSIGGLLIGFGARYAGGCTAGHSIMGIALLAGSSIITTVGFFIGGLASTYLLIPYLF